MANKDNLALASKLRENAARRNRPAVAGQISQALGIAPSDVSFLDLETTDNLCEGLKAVPSSDLIAYGKWESAYILASGTTELSAFQALLQQRILPTPAVLLRDNCTTVGGIAVSLPGILSRLEHLLEFEGEDFVVVATNMTCGVIVEHFMATHPTGIQGKVFRICYWIGQRG